MNRHERRAANAQQKKQKRAAQVPLDAIARRIEKEMGFARGRLRLALTPVSATQVQYQIFADPRIKGEAVTRVQELFAAELDKFSKARGGTVDSGQRVDAVDDLTNTVVR